MPICNTFKMYVEQLVVQIELIRKTRIRGLLWKIRLANTSNMCQLEITFRGVLCRSHEIKTARPKYTEPEWWIFFPTDELHDSTE